MSVKWYTLVISVLSLTCAAGATAQEEQILKIKVEGFEDTRILLVTDEHNAVQGIHVVNSDPTSGVDQTVPIATLKKGYMQKKKVAGMMFDAMSIKAPHLDSRTGGEIELAYRLEPKLFSAFSKPIKVTLAKNGSNRWVLQRQDKEVKNFELIVEERKRADGKFEIERIKDYRFTALEFQKALALLESPNHDEARIAFTGEKGSSEPSTLNHIARDYTASTVDAAL